jgi:tungstate transport system ATP-binding protein
MSGRDNLAFFASLYGAPASRVVELMRAVGMTDVASRRVKTYSGGMKQRLLIARALVNEPEVLFLDEPTASLDPSSARAVENIIASIHRAGTKIIMTTHDLALARRLADEILFLHRGQLLDHQPAGAFFGLPATDEARAFLAGTLDW